MNLDYVCTETNLAYNMQFGSLIVSMLLQTAFVSMYSTVKWYNHFVGRALFGNAAGLWVVFIVIVSGRVFEYGGEEWVRAAAYWGLTTTIGFMVTALWRQQHAEKELAPKEAEH